MPSSTRRISPARTSRACCLPARTSPEQSPPSRRASRKARCAPSCDSPSIRVEFAALFPHGPTQTDAMASLLTEDHKRRFEADGFLILDRFLDAGMVERLRARIEPLFKGEVETGLYPDEWNWQEGRDRPDRTRQICNGWKSDRTVASVVLSEQVGRCVAELSGWAGARICQDNVIWKPAGAKALGYHQDDSYAKW